jgi:hypothetical protein
MGIRGTIGATAVAAVSMVSAGGGAASAHAATTCTWGGTPAAPTGQNRQTPGVTNTPSAVPLRFKASGPLGDDCSGTLTFIGQEDAGATCGLITFHGRAKGLPGVARFAGVSAGGIAPARLYDRAGNVVGTETAQFLTNAPFSECNTPEGLTSNNFSSVIHLFGRRSGPKARANAFDGTCTLSGELTFDEPLGNELRDTTFTDAAAGTCTGTLNGAPVDDVPVVNDVSGSGTVSCVAGHALSHDTLTFAHRIKVHIVSDAAFGLTQGVSHSTGAVSGDSVVHVNFLPYTDQSTLAACQAGTLRGAHYDLTARTITPLVG